MAFIPMPIALFLVFREAGASGVRQFLASAFDFSRIENKRWYLPTLLLMPAVTLIVFGVMTVVGVPMPDPIIQISMILPLLLVFLLSATGEELGWQGYVYDTLEARWNALIAAIVLGIIWAVWHIIPYFQTNNTPTWIFWQCIVTVALRVILVWLYKNTRRSVIIAILFHATTNLTAFLFPNNGSHYDPFYVALVLLSVVVTITFIWGTTTLGGKQS